MSASGAVFWALLEEAFMRKATDIHFCGGRILLRCSGEMLASEMFPEVPALEYRHLLESLLPGERQRLELAGRDGATDFAVTIEGRRVRVNIFRVAGGLSAALRPLPAHVMTPEESGVSDPVLKLVGSSRQGLVLVTGPSGSGKSSTIATLIEHLNAHRAYNIITIEDPIEHLFTPRRSIFSQREVGEHVGGFDRALRSALRENPDVIYVGEIRDHATMSTAMQAAETGHLVFATLHTTRVYTTVARLIEMAPGDERDEVRSRLANNLLLCVCQRLLRRTGGGVVACREVLMQHPAAATAIRTGRERDLNHVMLTHRHEGMMDWNGALRDLDLKGWVDASDARQYQTEEEKRQ
jgi:twitching motility protein PilT